MNYHLMVDDKFIDDFIEEMEAAIPGGNTYVYTFDPPSKYVTSDLGVYAPYGSVRFLEIASQISFGDRVLVHWLSDEAARFILSLPKDLEVGAFFWGGDFVSDPFFFHKQSLLGPLTLQLYNSKLEYPIFSSVNPVTVLRRFRFRLLKYIRIQYERAALKRNAVCRLDRLFHWSLLDHSYVERLYKTTIEPVYFFYGVGLNDEVAELENPYVSRNSPTRIWLGNSATVTNNHLEALEVLARFHDRDIEIVSPLSYGNSAYGEIISRRGDRIFGSKFRTLGNFLDRKRYYACMDDVDIVVMNHQRTQAAGNIWAFLKMGKKVFMNPVSTLFQLLVNSGIKVFELPSTGIAFQDFIEPLQPSAAAANYERLKLIFSEKKKRASLAMLT